MNHEARMKMYYKLLENKNYKKLKKLEDLKQFLDAEEYKYVENNIDKYSEKVKSLTSKLYRTLFKMEKLECPICQTSTDYEPFYRFLRSCPKCDNKVPINIAWSSRDEEFNFAKFLDKCEKLVSMYYKDIISFKTIKLRYLIDNWYWTLNEIEFYLNFYKSLSLKNIISIVNGEPMCKMCGKPTGYRSDTGKLISKRYCGHKCMHSDPEHISKVTDIIVAQFNEENRENTIAKIKETNIDRYGYENTFQVPEFKEKAKMTNLERYGDEVASRSEEVKQRTRESNKLKYDGYDNPSKHPKIIEKIKNIQIEKFGGWAMQNPEIVERVRKTNEEKFGCWPSQHPDIKQKAKETSIKNWGTEYPMQSPIVQEKFKETCIKKFGVPNPFAVPEIREKIKETWVQNYSVSNPFAVPEIREKIKDTWIQNYGVSNPSQSPAIQMKIKENRYRGNLIPGTKEYNLEVYGTENPEEDLGVKHMDQYYDKEFIESKFTLDDSTFDFQSYLEYFNIAVTTGYKHKEKLGIEIPNRYTTQGAIKDFIRDLGFKVLENDRKAIAPMELDIYVPEKNLAIEYHGLMFHSVGKSKYSMFNNYGTKRADYLRKLCAVKADLCDQKDIKLLQIFENEWLEHEETWKSIIKKELGICETVPIEYIITREINCTQAQEFLESNWIYNINYISSQALLYAGNIVALLLTDQNGYTRIIEHRDYRILNLDKILKGKKVLVDRRLEGQYITECIASKEHLEPKCYGFNENNIILQETIDSQFAIDQGNRVIWDAGYIVLEF